MNPYSPENAHDVVVVGNGAIGSSIALELARRGHAVALVGSVGRPNAASTAAGAMLGCFGEVTTGLVASPEGRTKLSLDVAATGMWDEWLTGIGEGAGLGPDDFRTARGTTVLLNTVGLSGIDDANFAEIRRQLDLYGARYDDLDVADLDWLDAEQKSRPLRAFHIPGEHAVDSGLVLDHERRAFAELGGTLVDADATALVRSGDRVTGVRLASGEQVLADRVMVAAGARSQDLLDTVPDVAARIPRLVSGYGVSALVDTASGTAPESVLRTPNRAFACGLHVVPRSQGRVYLGATNIVSPTPKQTPVIRDVSFLLECAHRQIRRELWSSDLHTVQVGNRPIALDGFPLLGATEIDGLWLASGTYRDGFHLSPLIAGEMADRMEGGTGRFDLDAFVPARAPIAALTRAETVETAVTHIMATGYEHDWRIPVDWHDYIELDFPPAYARWADEIDPDFTPPPELLASSRLHPDIVKWLRDYYDQWRGAAA